MQRLLPISPNRPTDLIKDAKALSDAGCEQLIVREAHRSRWELEQAIPSLKAHLPGLILHASNVNAWRFAEIYQTGLHLPSHLDPKLWRDRFSGLLGMSCHSEEDVENASRASIDYVLLSPMFPPVSKKDDPRPPLGPAVCSALQKEYAIRIFGLGGVNRDSIPKCHGVYGVASLGYLFGSRTDRRQLRKRTGILLNLVQKNHTPTSHFANAC